MFIHILAKPHLANAECIFCRKKNTAAVSGSGYEPLIISTTDQAAFAMHHLVDETNDSYAQAQIIHYSTDDIKAREFQHHRTCCRWTSKQRSQPAVDLKEREAREQCFGLLKGYVQEKVIGEGAILRKSAISEVYRRFQRMLNLSENVDKNQNLKKRLSKSFGDELSFFQRTPGSSKLVYDTKDCKDKTLRTKESMIIDVARELRAFIDELETTSVWPPDPEDIRQGDIKIPKRLQLFLRNLFTTEPPVSEGVHRLVKSLAQDMIYCVSRGRVKTVKHTQPGIFVVKKTGCKQIIEVLNRLGHFISYYEINALETAYADSQVNHQLSRAYISTGVQPSTFVTFAFDNCDHNPETLSGISIHCKFYT